MSDAEVLLSLGVALSPEDAAQVGAFVRRLVDADARVSTLEADLVRRGQALETYAKSWEGAERDLSAASSRVGTLEARIAELERERDELRRQLTFQRDTNHARNVEMDALHYVWCNGGCKGGVHRFTPGELTEEIVAAAERNTKRMRHWLANHLARLALHPAQPETPAAPGPYSGT